MLMLIPPEVILGQCVYTRPGKGSQIMSLIFHVTYINDVLQFTDITRPTVGFEQIHRRLLDLPDLLACPIRCAPHQIFHEQAKMRNVDSVGATLATCRNTVCKAFNEPMISSNIEACHRSFRCGL